MASKTNVAIHWFRHGLRIHDNPALLEALETCKVVYPIFIFDGDVAGTSTAGYNRMRFLLESLADLDKSFQKLGGRLFFYHGQPTQVLARLFTEWDVTLLSFEVDPEPIWAARDEQVQQLCDEQGVTCVSQISHTLWNPREVLDINGGSPPLTFRILMQATRALGSPPRPTQNPNWEHVELPTADYDSKLHQVPTPEALGVSKDQEPEVREQHCWQGGETHALQMFATRMQLEEKNFEAGYIIHDHLRPDLLGAPTSLSPHLRFGCLSVRKFYWGLIDTFKKVYPDEEPPEGLTGQLLWREYFYTMSVNNLQYNKMTTNDICLNIPWYTDEDKLNKWEKGRTGFPFVDAVMRQLRAEGWIHHVARHLVACFLTRGDLWISWELGLKMFDKYLLDADWSVCAGNWMWVSSSAFEKALQCPRCLHPSWYGARMDPSGEYIRRYVPELKHMPIEFLFEPWKAPLSVQRLSNCVVGEDYPAPIVDHDEASAHCAMLMANAKANILRQFNDNVPQHCAPSDVEEVRQFVWLPDSVSSTSYSYQVEHSCGIEAL